MINLALLLGILLQAPASGQPQPPAAANPVATIDTSVGAIRIELFADKAPVSVENFLQDVQDNFYTGTIFHRVVPGYVVQGGGYSPELAEKATRAPIQNEATNGIRNQRGTVAMARTRALRSATSQFYINLSDNPKLDHYSYAPDEFGYAVFGRVIEGMDVADRIGAVPTATKDGMENVPVTPVVIKGITVKR
jgi:cyclophilin family peptidyl-prolyl cis-trans isomerase